MKLIIKNFRSIISRNIDIEDFGLILLSADNGRGKSTLCKAITWCLYGNMNNLENNQKISFGDGRTSVTIFMKSDTYQLTIIRAKKPDEVKVIINFEGRDHIYTDKGAQTKINEKFGTEDVWNACSYLEHRGTHPIIKSSPADKAKLLTNLAFGGEDSDEIRKKIIENLKSKKSSTMTQTSELSGVINMLREKASNDPIIQFNMDTLKSTLNYKNIELEALSNEIDKTKSIVMRENHLKNEIHKVKSKISILENQPEISDSDIVESEIADQKLKLVPEIVKNASKVITDLKAWRNLNIGHRLQELYRINDAEHLMSKEISNYERDTSNIKKHDNYEKYIKIKRYDDYSAILDKCIMPTEPKPTVEDFEKYSIKELVCPCCENGLIMENGVLKRGKSNNEMRETYANKLIKLKILKEEHETYEFNIKLANKLKCEKPKNYDFWVENGRNVYVKPAGSKPSLSWKEEDIDEMRNFLTLKLPKIDINIRLSTIEKTINNAEEYLSIKKPQYSSQEIVKARNRNKELEIQKINLEELVSNLNKLDDYEDLEKLNHKKQQLNDAINKLQNDIDAVNRGNEIAKYSAKLTNNMNIIKDYDKLDTIINKVVSESVDNIVKSINSTSNMILKELFVDPLYIEITSTKTVKTGSEKIRFTPSIKIYYKGKEQSVDAFSDGEYCLISLAIVLSMSRLYTSKILILDEVFACLSDENKDLAFNILKKWADKLTVITVCHGVNEGYFNKVVKL